MNIIKMRKALITSKTSKNPGLIRSYDDGKVLQKDQRNKIFLIAAD